MIDPKTEARMILDGMRKHTAFLNSQEQDAIVDAIATALAAKDAELAKRPDWPTVNATYEKWKVRAERAEARVAELEKALDEIIAIDRTERKVAEYGHSYVQETDGPLAAIARRVLDGGKEDG